jgi:intracellular sulfur oxidation DsrE/DsrF family protein
MIALQSVRFGCTTARNSYSRTHFSKSSSVQRLRMQRKRPHGTSESDIARRFVSIVAPLILSNNLLVSNAADAYLPKQHQEMTAMKSLPGRRDALRTFGLSMATGAIGLASAGAKPAAAAVEAALTPPGATHLDALRKRLAQAPRRRDFKAVPMILNHQEQWDHEALTEVLSYRPAPKQAWDSIDIGSPWLSLMRNALNTQIWSFKHPDFLAVSVTHGTAHLALYDQAMWDKHQLARLAGEKFKANTLIIEQKAAAADPANYEGPAGVFSSEDNSIPALMRRGVVFMCCHNAIWEQAAALIKADVNPDKLSHAALAAELTNHLVDGVVLIPGAGGTMLELQQVGFHYA